MRRLFPLLFLVLFSLVACQQDNESIAPVADEDLSFRDAPRPFKGNAVLVLAPADIPQCDCEDVLPGPMIGPGNVTHLGNTTMTTEICFEIINPAVAHITEQCVVFTAANGDELWATTEPYDVFFDLDCFCNSGSSVYHFIGGTGRFADASGYTAFDVVVDIDPNLFIPTQAKVKMEGEIMY